MHQVGRRQANVLCQFVFDRSWSSQMLAAALFLWFSVLCFVDEVADSLRKRELCAGAQHLEVLCLQVLWWVQELQMITDVCCFCILFYLYQPW
jgi:hypothetical protein